jgi:hypothetical protein
MIVHRGAVIEYGETLSSEDQCANHSSQQNGCESHIKEEKLLQLLLWKMVHFALF